MREKTCYEISTHFYKEKNCADFPVQMSVRVYFQLDLLNSIRSPQEVLLYLRSCFHRFCKALVSFFSSHSTRTFCFFQQLVISDYKPRGLAQFYYNEPQFFCNLSACAIYFGDFKLSKKSSQWNLRRCMEFPSISTKNVRVPLTLTPHVYYHTATH